MAAAPNLDVVTCAVCQKSHVMPSAAVSIPPNKKAEQQSAYCTTQLTGIQQITEVRGMSGLGRLSDSEIL